MFVCSGFSFDHFGKPGVINPDVQRQTIESLLTGNKAPVENCMMPEFIRLAPPLHIAEDEVILLMLQIRIQYEKLKTLESIL